MAKMMCITCNKEITEDQDYTTLQCHAAGQTTSHISTAHDKCWEKFKKSFVRGRGTSNRTQTFFCPAPGCHNALQNQHMAVRKKTDGHERRAATGQGNDDIADYLGPDMGKKGKGTLRASAREEEPESEEEEDRCKELKKDGTRCVRCIFDAELGVCRTMALAEAATSKKRPRVAVLQPIAGIFKGERHG